MNQLCDLIRIILFFGFYERKTPAIVLFAKLGRRESNSLLFIGLSKSADRENRFGAVDGKTRFDVPLALLVQMHNSHLSSRLKLDGKLRAGCLLSGIPSKTYFSSRLRGSPVVNRTLVYNIATNGEKIFH